MPSDTYVDVAERIKLLSRVGAYQYAYESTSDRESAQPPCIFLLYISVFSDRIYVSIASSQRVFLFKMHAAP